MAIVSAPGNIERLERYRTISRRLALGVGDASTLLPGAGSALVWKANAVEVGKALRQIQRARERHRDAYDG